MNVTDISRTSASDSGVRADSDICAIITTYEPAANLRSLIAAAIRQVGCVFLINDSGSPDVQKALDTEFAGLSGLQIHHMPTNSGIAAALNRGLDAAKSRGYKKALLLDDDTRIGQHLVLKLIEAWERLEREGYEPGVIGVSRAAVLPPPGVPADEEKAAGWLPVRGVITAGSIVDIKSAGRVGAFREEFVIDAVDYEFCARLRQNGLLVARLSDALIEQPVGESKTVRIAGLKFSTTNHSPLRRYYMYRNNLIFAKEQLFKDPLLSLAIFWFLTKTLLLVVCFETQRPRKIKAILRGVLDGFNRRMGHASRAF